jgi:hypothetical protein
MPLGNGEAVLASITIVRTAAYADRLRDYTIELDGQVLGEMAEGETSTYEVAPGRHQLEARVDWCGSQRVAFSVAADEDVKFVVSSNLGGAKVVLNLWYIAFARKSYLRLRQVPDFCGVGVTGPEPLELDWKSFVLKRGVLGWGLIMGVFWPLVMYLMGSPISFSAAILMLPVWLVGGAIWGAIMWRWFNRRFAAEIAAREARVFGPENTPPR